MPNKSQTPRDARQFEVLEAFELAGRGTVVVLKQFTGLTPGIGCEVWVTSPNEPPFQATGFQEYLLRASVKPEESALLLLGVTRTQVPAGSLITVPIPPVSATVAKE